MEENFSKRAEVVMISLFALFVSIIILVFAISTLGSRSFPIVNYGSDKSQSLLTDKEIKSLKDAITVQVPSAKNGNLSIRWSSYSESMPGYKKFLMDFDDIEQTYSVLINNGVTYISCPKMSETKYPNSFCATNYGEGNDSITTYLGDILPYDGASKAGVKYRMYRSDHDRKLYVHIYNCETDDNKNSVMESVKSVISNLGVNPEIFNYSISFNSCSK